MKPFLDVEKNRRAYHQNASRNTVHRTSLLAPKMRGAATHISFLNHFLIKRGYSEVMCKITALDHDGNPTQSASVEITEPRVYTICLDNFFDGATETSQYMVEFYSHKNLFIPFPAVMVNHVGAQFINVVHSYNRVLNDIFENDAVNKHQVSEASIDVCVDERYDTFFNFAAGPFRPAGNIEVTASGGGQKLLGQVAVEMPRMVSQSHFLSAIFPGRTIESGAVLKILQPKQELFYGRMLSGMIDRETGAFSANHSYYDSSNTAEYFDNTKSQRVYPYFEGFLNRVTMYPIMSPGTVAVHIRIHVGGESIDSPPKLLRSPSDTPVTFDIDELVLNHGVTGCSAFEVIATAQHKEKIPTRMMHQLGYGMRQSRSKLLSSIAIGLYNQQSFVPPGKTGFTWGQMLCDAEYESRVGLCFGIGDGEGDTVELEIYDESGQLTQSKSFLRPCESLMLDQSSLGLNARRGSFVWFVAKSNRPDLSAQSFHAHRISHNSSGEHSF